MVGNLYMEKEIGTAQIQLKSREPPTGLWKVMGSLSFLHFKSNFLTAFFAIKLLDAPVSNSTLTGMFLTVRIPSKTSDLPSLAQGARVSATSFT